MKKKIEISKDFLIKEYLEKRKTMGEIASQLGISTIPIARLLKEYNIASRNRSTCQIKILRNYHDKEWLMNQYLVNEKSMPTIAKEENVSDCIIFKYIKRFGIKTRKNGYQWIGEKNPNFNGYKIQSNGYILDRKLNHQRANGDGYVFRHTLIMEKYLKRNLIKGEVVHHKDGDKKNNSISNLQLFPNMSEHLKYEGKTNRFIKEFLWTKKYPKKLRDKLIDYFNMFLAEK